MKLNYSAWSGGCLADGSSDFVNRLGLSWVSNISAPLEEGGAFTALYRLAPCLYAMPYGQINGRVVVITAEKARLTWGVKKLPKSAAF